MNNTLKNIFKMKKNQNQNLWKVATLFFAASSICLLLTAFSKDDNPQENTTAPLIATNPIIATKTEAQALYSNFKRINPKFTQQGGTLTKTTLQSLLSKMNGDGDTTIYYYFGANPKSENVIMLFSDPAFHPLNDTPKYKSITPFCPPTCNKDLVNYLTL